MICSHLRKLIFVKVRKAAGSSIEMALRPLCGAEDIVTPLGIVEEPSLASFPPRNYLVGDWKRETRPDGIIRPQSPADYQSHMPAAEIRTAVGPEIWSSYFKFAFVRNPWDQELSLYFHRQRYEARKTPFEEYLYATEPILTFEQVTIEGSNAMDFVGKYETLQKDLRHVFDRFGVTLPLLHHAKSGVRPKRPYQDFYGFRAREFVARRYSRLIEMFGYTFDGTS